MTIYLTDRQIAAELGIKPDKWETISVVLERSGLPPRDPLFDERRCWPAVLEFLMKRAGVGGANTAASVQNGGQYNGFKPKKGARTNREDEQNDRSGATVLALHARGE